MDCWGGARNTVRAAHRLECVRSLESRRRFWGAFLFPLFRWCVNDNSTRSKGKPPIPAARQPISVHTEYLNDSHVAVRKLSVRFLSRYI